MDQEALTELNVGQNLDDLMNLDPRGYGVCRILYEGSRKLAGEPLTIHAAKKLMETVREGDEVLILTGFVLTPSLCAETDGIIGAMLFARAVQKAFRAVPVLVCPEENVPAVRGIAPLIGLHLYESVKEAKRFPFSMACLTFPKDAEKAAARAEEIIAQGLPSVAVTIEFPGANAKGEYHNAVGKSVTALEAKADILFERLQEKGVPTISIGDLGNEMGLGTLGGHLNRYIPYAAPGACSCGCGCGIAVATRAETVLTATVSNWGSDGMIAALAFLKKDPEILHDGELLAEVIKTASRCGMVNMDGSLTPAVDGFGLKMNVLILELMRECVTYALDYANYEPGRTWFQKVLELGFFQHKE
ncbi:DUF4392 domain-containing protein [Caproiciproducens sp. NJN-50]|uniref:DUF4392 domain-containing protein n=1 Tax=Acutalibacteraceae TaxID=3082771 RepID=UPI000FFE0E6E|nr:MULTISPECIES: DUF4392 domain-containing protein [Acutalibacteraceae]QAT49170.1 DUF4392 domain-containing protein [Caproiciproducens sp. NJN-50]